MDGRTPKRNVRFLLGATAAAAIISVAVAFFGAEEIDLEAVVPWPQITGVNETGRGWAITILLSLPVIAAIPLAFRGRPAAGASATAFALFLAFIMFSWNRLGLLYAPSAWMLGRATLAALNRESSGEQSKTVS